MMMSSIKPKEQVPVEQKHFWGAVHRFWQDLLPLRL